MSIYFYIIEFKIPIIIIWILSSLFFIIFFKKNKSELGFFEAISASGPIIIFGILLFITSILLIFMFIGFFLNLIPNNKIGLAILIGICLLPFLISLKKK
jgi:hypothetical protein